MKITDPEVIKSGEKDLIESVQEDLDLGAVREILKERMAVAALTSKGGQIVVHNNEIAFRLDFEVNLSGSLLFDRQGNLLDESDPEPPQESEGNLDDGIDFSGFEDEISLSDASGPDTTGENEEYTQSFPQEEDPALEEDLGEDLEEELSIDLPDYDLEEELEDGGELEDELEIDDEDDLEKNLEEAMGLEEDLDLGDDLPPLSNDEPDDDLTMEEDPYMADDEDDEGDLDEVDLGEMEGEIDPEDDPMNSQDLDDDINDIIKESREFWEQKKDS